MSVPAKKHLTEVLIGAKHPQRFLLPEEAVKGLLVLFKDFKVNDEEYVSADEVLSDLYYETSEASVRLRGFRQREGLTQSELAKKMKTTQSVIASLETAKRPISYKMAQKLAAFFDTSVDAFLSKVD